MALNSSEPNYMQPFGSAMVGRRQKAFSELAHREFKEELTAADLAANSDMEASCQWHGCLPAWIEDGGDKREAQLVNQKNRANGHQGNSFDFGEK